jgi:ABC-2 type transport system ATP-binding protein
VLIINRGQIVAEDTPANLQAQLAGGERLRVQAAMETRELLALVRGIPGVTRAQPGGAEGAVEISSAPGQDVRPAVARKVVEGGFDLLEMRPVSISLEEIFLQLTREEGSTDAEKVRDA